MDELLAGMNDQQRSREILDFIAERRRATHAQLEEIVTALNQARADAETARRDRDRLQEQVNELRDRVFQAESEAAALRDAQPSAATSKAMRWAVASARVIRRVGG